MEIQKQEIELLFRQYIDGTITTTDLKRLQVLSEQLPGEHLIRQAIEQHFASQSAAEPELRASAEKISAQAWLAVKEHIGAGTKQRPNLKIWLYAVASSIVLIPIITFLILNSGKSGNTALAGADIKPGSNKATLVLSNGNRYTLDGRQNGISFSHNGITYTNGALLASGTDLAQAVLQVPRGGQYEVTLSDGTRVKLNSASTLTYPGRFTEGQRLVQLEGEAYFEVAKDKSHPFKVMTKGQLITVLGTHFNVQAYSKEPVYTTLLEGSVRLEPGFDKNSSLVLRPGQQSRLNGQNLSVAAVNAEEAIAWADNLFVFNNMSLEQIMVQLGRWYDVDVTIPDKLARQHLYAEIPKDRTLAQVITILEKASRLKFTIEGRRLTVSQ